MSDRQARACNRCGHSPCQCHTFFDEVGEEVEERDFQFAEQVVTRLEWMNDEDRAEFFTYLGDNYCLKCGKDLAEVLGRCGCITATQPIQRRIEELEGALQPFADYVEYRGEAMPDTTRLDEYTDIVTLGNCRLARALLPPKEQPT